MTARRGPCRSPSAHAARAGGAFPAGSVTALQTPGLDYPGGYHARVSGATIVSAPRAQAAQLVSCSGRGRGVGDGPAWCGSLDRRLPAASGGTGAAAVAPARAGPPCIASRYGRRWACTRRRCGGPSVTLNGHRARSDRRGVARLRVRLGRRRGGYRARRAHARPGDRADPPSVSGWRRAPGGYTGGMSRSAVVLQALEPRADQHLRAVRPRRLPGAGAGGPDSLRRLPRGARRADRRRSGPERDGRRRHDALVAPDT